MKTLSIAVCSIAILAAHFSMPLSASAQDAPKLSLEQKTSLRCSAAFAIVADGQARGNADALEYPALAERGREFFVRSSARLMDDAGLDRAQISKLMQIEAQDLWDKGEVEQIMPSCLLLLNASGI